MNDERRINFRVAPDLFDRLDDKRHKEKTTWQDVGVHLFTEWLEGKRVVSGQSSAESIDRTEADRIYLALKRMRSEGDTLARVIAGSLLDRKEVKEKK